MADVVMGATRPMAVFLSVAFPIYAVNRFYGKALVCVVAFFALVVESGYEAGRLLVMICFVGGVNTYMFVWIMRKRELITFKNLVVKVGFGRILATSFVLFVVAYFTFGIFPAIRNPDLDKCMDRYLESMSGAVVSDSVRLMSQRFGLPSIQYFAYGTAYMSSPVMRLCFYLEFTDLAETYACGGYNFTHVERVLFALSDRESTFSETRSRIAEISALGTNPWKTGNFDFILDFGYIGSLFAMALFGYVSNRVYRYAISRPCVEGVVLLSVMQVNIVSFGFSSKFPIGPVMNSIYFALFLVVFLRSRGGGRAVLFAR